MIDIKNLKTSWTNSTKAEKVIIAILLAFILMLLLDRFETASTEPTNNNNGNQQNTNTGDNQEMPTFTFPGADPKRNYSETDVKRIQKYPDHKVYVYDWDFSKLYFGGSTELYSHEVLTKDISVHPQWYYRNVNYGYDIAVLRVERVDTHTDTIPLASMTEFNNLNSCDYFTVYGTGMKQNSEFSLDKLLKTDLQQNVDCHKLDQWEDWKNGVLENTFYNMAPEFDSAICVNASVEAQTQTHNGNNQDDPSVPCVGDSGGPLVKDGKLFGMVSYTYSTPPCITGPFATVFTSVANFIDWLKINSDNDLSEDSSADLPETTCDQNGRMGRIANGIEVTDEDETPFYSRILSCQNVDSQNKAIDCGTCGAAWIGGKTLVTAAHCVDPDFYYESLG